MEKARDIPCDAIIFDLEDAVSPDSKASARQQIGEALQTGGYGDRELVVRCNGLDTPWGAEDVMAFAGAQIAALLFPKIEAQQRRTAMHAIDSYPKPRGGILCLFERETHRPPRLQGDRWKGCTQLAHDASSQPLECAAIHVKVRLFGLLVDAFDKDEIRRTAVEIGFDDLIGRVAAGLAEDLLEPRVSQPPRPA